MTAASRRSTCAVAVMVASPRRSLTRPAFHRRQHTITAPELLDDGLRVGGPDERFRALVVLVDEAVDRLLQGDQRGKAAALEPPLAQLGEEGLDRVQPRARGR